MRWTSLKSPTHSPAHATSACPMPEPLARQQSAMRDHPPSSIACPNRYERVLPHEASRGEWTAAYEAANHERVGGRLTRVQLLTGSTLPMLPVLEEVLMLQRPASLLKARGIHSSSWDCYYMPANPQKSNNMTLKNSTVPHFPVCAITSDCQEVCSGA